MIGIGIGLDKFKKRGGWGENLFDSGKGEFTSDTESWTAKGNNTIEVDSESLKCTYVDNVEGAELLLNDARDLSTDLTIGKVYKLSGSTKVSTGDSLRINVYDGSASNYGDYITSTSFVGFEIEFTANSATLCKVLFNKMGAGEIVWVDHLILQQRK